MSALVWSSPPSELQLRRPVLLLALEGWFDVGETATGALRWLRGRLEATPAGTISCEPYVDMISHRPSISYALEGPPRMTWPDTAVDVARVDGGTHDLVILTGIEPDYRWRSYVEDVLTVARLTGAELVVTLGAMIAGVPHTREPVITASASTVELTHALGTALPSYQGVTGVIGVLQQTLGARNLPGVSLRVPVPHYLGGSTNPPCTRALLARIQTLIGVSTGYEELDSTVAMWRSQVDQAVADHDEAPHIVRQLEAAYDDAAQPDADQLVADLERYLQARREE